MVAPAHIRLDAALIARIERRCGIEDPDDADERWERNWRARVAARYFIRSRLAQQEVSRAG